MWETPLDSICLAQTSPVSSVCLCFKASTQELQKPMRHLHIDFSPSPQTWHVLKIKLPQFLLPKVLRPRERQLLCGPLHPIMALLSPQGNPPGQREVYMWEFRGGSKLLFVNHFYLGILKKKLRIPFPASHQDICSHAPVFVFLRNWVSFFRKHLGGVSRIWSWGLGCLYLSFSDPSPCGVNWF